MDSYGKSTGTTSDGQPSQLNPLDVAQPSDTKFCKSETRFSELGTRLGKLETKFGELETRVRKLETRLGELLIRFGKAVLLSLLTGVVLNLLIGLFIILFSEKDLYAQLDPLELQL